MAKKETKLKVISHPQSYDLEMYDCGEPFEEPQYISLIQEIEALFQNFMYYIGKIIVPPLESKLSENSKSRILLEKIFTQYYDNKLFEYDPSGEEQYYETPKIDKNDDDLTPSERFWKQYSDN